jgi:hypothetical protein
MSQYVGLIGVRVGGGGGCCVWASSRSWCCQIVRGSVLKENGLKIEVKPGFTQLLSIFIVAPHATV